MSRFDIRNISIKLSRNILLEIAIAIAVFFVFIKYQKQLNLQLNPSLIGRAYSESQYVLGDQAINKIDDNTVYQYAAIAYLHGDDPTTINFEHPPLGKYVYGLSYKLTNKIFLINIALYAICLMLFAKLLSQLKIATAFSLVSLFGFAFLSSLDYHVSITLLDMQTLVWSLLFFVILFSSHENWQKYLGLGVALGGFISTKYLFPLVFLYLLLLMIWLYRNKKLKYLWIILTTASVIYVASYTVYFLHHSPVDFIKFEWFRFRWWTGNRTIPRFIILQTLFFGQFRAWWAAGGNYMKDNSWNITWPILFIVHLISFFTSKFTLKSIMIWVYSISLMMIYLFSSAVYGRYFLQLIPFWWLTIGMAYAQKKS